MIRLGKSPTNLEAISLMTEILLTHILILSYQEKFMSFKSTKQNLGPSKSKMKKQGNGILYGMFGVVIVIYTPKIFCVYKRILFYHSFAKFI